MKLNFKSGIAVALAALSVLPAQAREFGTPAVMPSGATMGSPVGANFPVPGFYLSSRSAIVNGEAYDANGNETPIGLGVKSTALQLHWTPGFELLGGTYRAMGIVAFQDLALSNGGVNISDNQSLSDLTISPLNIHWMTAPGVFFGAGVSFSIPVGEFKTNGDPSGGNNAPAVAFDASYSYLRDGWNLSVHANYFIHGENPDSDYTSGDEMLINWTAMKAVGAKGWSLGAVGYYRQQITDDKNTGAAYGGTTAGKLRENAVGLAVSKRMGPLEVYADYTWNTMTENSLGADVLRLNVTFPLGKK